jgi:hypothetical protein
MPTLLRTMNGSLDIDKLPLVASRTAWSKLLGISIEKLAYEQRLGRLKPLPRTDWNVMIPKESIVEWFSKYG